ncbi:predicted protein [Aspergillus nidulans FGSC A4]|uniref:Uncharacterized protein n=1 Tax=Emericella nidulans (strain FGSC A4 / ATCC 38163 / CBS 112.46 / NRRL 194 / M139) TaxID=227321 RepID=Q5AWW1_EMENI|nr:hypothetical protein [Aspergillus nidulans FGSC A4]EAA61266.1 predicted protein [Aspergillus nidulans FGSC A4]CBF78831.1 TPA: conserved hypothetical protein [Aspergillus nidulans FGSC A4]|eukprot:XP_680488.1 predicted protein [Aspergillus nidulans FGSC A4]
MSCTALILSNQRRRQQVLLAQTGVPGTKRGTHQGATAAVARLESALERMCQAIISSTDVVIGARIPTSHQQIAHRLRDTVKTCLLSAMDGNGCQDDFACSNQSEQLPKQSQAQGDHEKWPRPSQHAGLGVLPPARNAPFAPQSMPPAADATTMKAALFANQLRLYARLNNKQPDRCSDIPYFRLGGAGTHYSGVSGQNQTELGKEQNSREIRIPDTLSAFSPEVQKDLDGDWFDLFDLVGYVRTHGVALSMAPPVEDTAYRKVNAVDFAAGRLTFRVLCHARGGYLTIISSGRKGICLGHSPGFKRSDVEIAIDSSCWK